MHVNRVCTMLTSWSCCSFVAGADAKLAIESGPYNEDVDEGILPGAGSICLLEVSTPAKIRASLQLA